MDSEDKLFLVLKKPSLDEMRAIMDKFHWTREYLDSGYGAEEKSREKLKYFGWDFDEYCRAIGSM